MKKTTTYRYSLLRYLVCLQILMGSTFLSHSQYNTPQNNIWMFGFKAGLNFNNGSPVPISSNINASNVSGTLESNSAVSDSNGVLQFYTDGSLVWNSLGNLMPNGSNLTGLGNDVTNSTSQGSLIIPMPDSAGKYYIFSLTATDQPVTIKGRMFYSVLDMSLNGGLGDIVAGRKGIAVDSGLTEKMMGVLGDRCNVWVVTCARAQSAYKAFEINAAGFNPTPVVSNIGTPKNLAFGYLAISPDRKWIAASEQAIFGGNNGLELSKFDPATGVVSNSIQLEPLNGYYGVCFSPDNKKLYGNSFQSVYQFDLTVADPAATKTLICDNGRGTALQLGPDSRIYFHHSGTTYNRVSYIRFPNQAGLACQPLLDTLTLYSGSTFNFGFHNTIPVFKRDTLYHNDTLSAGCFASSFHLKATDTTGWDYLWNNGSTAVDINATNSGTFWVSYHTPPCVFHTDTFHLRFPEGFLPQIEVANSCKGSHNGKAFAYTYPGDIITYHYAWLSAAGDTLSLSDTLYNAAAGQYQLRVRTIHCDTTLIFFVSEEEHNVSFVSDTLICLGSALPFNNTSDSHFTSYQWFFGDGDGSAMVSPTHLYNQPGYFNAMLVGKGPICSDTVQRYITVDAPMEDFLFDKDKDSICIGETVFFYPIVDSTTTSLAWTFGDGNSLTIAGETIQHAYDNAGLMQLLLKASFRACPDLSFHDSVYVSTLPVVDLGPDTVLCLDGKAIELSNHRPLQPGDQYRWNDGSTTTSIRATHDGTYTLSVTNGHGCTGSETVVIHKDCYIDIPNAFSPNGDGVNDYFFPRQFLSRKVTRFRMQVLNRWGQVLFESTAVNGRGWDGRFNGKEQPEGVYLYLIETILDQSQEEKYTGNVTLVR